MYVIENRLHANDRTLMTLVSIDTLEKELSDKTSISQLDEVKANIVRMQQLAANSEEMA